METPSSFKTLKDALKFCLAFNQKLLTSFEGGLDRDKILAQQAKIIEELAANNLTSSNNEVEQDLKK
jgi:hypothetical protein